MPIKTEGSQFPEIDIKLKKILQERIKNRNRRGRFKQTLADEYKRIALKIGVSSRAVEAWANNENRITYFNAIKLRAVIKVPWRVLFKMNFQPRIARKYNHKKIS